jgi:hypothetical protein
MQYVYLLIEREFLQSAVPVYKIGRTSQENNKRFLQYPKGSRLIFQINVTDSYFLEQEIISLFKHKYILRTDIGHEYFEGDATNMQIDIFDLAITYNRIVPNTTQLFSEFKKIHKTNMKSVLLQLSRMKPIEIPVEIDTVSFESSITNEKIEDISLTQSIFPSKIIEGNIRTCEICKYYTRIKSSYDDHMKSKRHHKNLINIPQFQCEICNKKFETKSGMSRHTRSCNIKKQSEENKKQKEINVIREKVREEIYAQMCV